MKSNRLWIPTGASPDEIIGSDCEYALVDPATGKLVFAVYPTPERCVDCNAELPSYRVLLICDECANG